MDLFRVVLIFTIVLSGALFTVSAEGVLSSEADAVRAAVRQRVLLNGRSRASETATSTMTRKKKKKERKACSESEALINKDACSCKEDETKICHQSRQYCAKSGQDCWVYHTCKCKAKF